LAWSQVSELLPPLKIFGEDDEEKSRAEFLDRVRSELVRILYFCGLKLTLMVPTNYCLFFQ
jgi:hypothetical protein